VIGRSMSIEIDVVVKNGVYYLIEVKSSVYKYDVYLFDASFV